MKDRSNHRFSLLILLLIATAWAGSKFFVNNYSTSEFQELDEENKKPLKNKGARKIASIYPPSRSLQELNPSRPRLSENRIERINEAAEAFTSDEGETENNVVIDSDQGGSAESSIPIPITGSYSQPTSQASSSNASSIQGRSAGTGQTYAQTTLSNGGSVTFGNIANYTAGTAAETNSPANNRNDNDNNNSNVGNTLSCSASVASGSYSYALSVSLSCSSTAQIRYCLSDGACCDPNSPEGINYISSNPIIIGENNSQYCLSYFATTNTNSTTAISRRTYTISKQLPDLYVETPVTWMQTTEASIYANVSSQNFGQNNFSLGQISYLSNNISPSGDDLGCEEVSSMMGNYVSPSPLYTLSPFNIASLSANQQVEIPLSPANLVYGVNYIATYLVNSNNAIPTYTCSISEITLIDFPYFESSGLSATAEITGGFTPFGFYEEDFHFPRSPAGQSSSGDTHQKIETAFLSIIY